MIIRIPDRGFAGRLRRALLAAALVPLLGLVGCAAPGDAESEPQDAAQRVATWNDVWNAAYADGSDGVDEVEGVAEDFPEGIPLPDGELAYSATGDGVWDMVFETADAEQQAESLVATMGQKAVPIEDGSTGDDGRYWRFLDDRHAIQIEMRPGPFPPAMVGIVVIELARAG